MRLIDADELLRLSHRFHISEFDRDGVEIIYADTVRNAPTVEAQKTGKWLEAEQRDRTICSVCGYWQDLKAKFLFSFCPNCGSLMRGGYTNENISDS